MKTDDILAMWRDDARLDDTKLDKEACNISVLHHKYYEIYVQEKMILMSYEEDMARLRRAKYEFYTQGHNEETRKLGWQMPPKGMVLKPEVNMYLEADPDISKLSLRIGMQKTKIELLESIIKTIGNRNYIIKSSIDFMKFASGY